MKLDLEKITRDVFSELEKRKIKYCIYNGYEELPDRVEGDLDIAIEKRAFPFLEGILDSVAKKHGAVLLHKIWHDVGKVAYIISPYVLERPERLQLDFMSEYSLRDYARRNTPFRYIFFEAKELLEERRRRDYYFIPPPHLEFMVKLLRRIFKEDFKEEKFNRIFTLYEKEPDKARTILRSFFPLSSGKIIQALKEKDLSWFKNNRGKLIGELKRFRRKSFTPTRLWGSLKRFLNRIFHPVGMTVAFLGPDGSGKSTLVEKTAELLSRSFHGTKIFYWRPGLLKEPGVAFGLRKEVKGENPDPHGHPPEHPLKSLFRFLYYFLDFTLGYWIKVWPLKVKKHLCVFDRYYYDVLVDPFRYNFSLPRWLLKVPLKFIPEPDLTFVIDVEPEVAILRKKELPLEEIKRQREGFRKVTLKIKNAQIIPNQDSLSEALRKISTIIIKNKSWRTSG